MRIVRIKYLHKGPNNKLEAIAWVGEPFGDTAISIKKNKYREVSDKVALAILSSPRAICEIENPFLDRS